MFLKRFQLRGLAHQNSELVRTTEEELKARSATGAAVIDIRPGTEYAEGHFPGSLNIGLANQAFASCFSLLLPKKREIFLVVDKPAEAVGAQADLARGGQRVFGFLEASVLTEVHRLTQLSAVDLNSTLLRGGKPAILDVRSPGEWKSNRIAGSRNIPLAQLAGRFREFSSASPLVVVCQDGYHSAAASSWLQAKGFDSIQHLLGGMDAYTNEHCNEHLETFTFCSSQPGSTACQS
jgi:hydroxyacylglutathione hydrolase